MNNFWKNKKVFLTGHTGFKGSWLSLWLQALGAKVTGYALSPSTNPNMFALASVEYGMTSIIGDIRDINNLSNAIKDSNPEIVIHMAAQSLVRHSYQNPAETYATNVMGTVNILEVVRSLKKVRAFINVTSDKCYENKEWLWGYREVDSLGGYDPYSSSKACSELITSAYRESFYNINNFEGHKKAIASARAGNVIGGGDWSIDRLVPDFIRSIANHKVIDIRNPNSTKLRIFLSLLMSNIIKSIFSFSD
jgi:CDP-glucose 4,6-dehydratase